MRREPHRDPSRLVISIPHRIAYGSVCFKRSRGIASSPPWRDAVTGRSWDGATLTALLSVSTRLPEDRA